MDTRRLRAFLKIAELGSISRAADALGLTQPSLGQQLLRLEDEVGVKLFERTARGVAITEAGRMFEGRARKILEEVERALEDLQRWKGAARARVTLAMPYSISKLLGTSLAEAAIERCPKVALRVIEGFSGQIRTMVDGCSVDLALIYDDVNVDALQTKRLAREELYLVGPRGRWPGLESDASVSPTELASVPLILPGPQHGLRVFLDQTSRRLGFRLEIASEIDSLQHIAGLVADGHGLSVLPLSAIERELEAGAMSAVRLGEGAFRRTLCMVRRPDAVITDALRAVETLTVSMLAGVIAKRRWIAELEDDLNDAE